MSRTVHDLVAGSGLTFASRGEHELKGVSGRWELFAVTHAGEQPEDLPREESMQTSDGQDWCCRPPVGLRRSREPSSGWAMPLERRRARMG